MEQESNNQNFKYTNKQIWSSLNKFVLLICALAVTYVLVYVILSANGAYQPELVGLHGVELYTWAPLGYYDANHPWKGSQAAKISKATIYGGWKNTLLVQAFYPLYRIDISYIHKCK
jgi:hypothetical protein